MSNLIKVVTIIAILGILTGCKATQYNYTSKAFLPHYTTSNETVMNVMKTEESKSRSYGVIAATDEGRNNYLLIAPKLAQESTVRNQLSNFNITQATYIDLDAAQRFSESLKKIISEWDKSREEDGYFYEFASAPIIDVNESENQIISFAPSVRFFFNITNSGPTGQLIIEYQVQRTNQSTIRRITMSKKETVIDLQTLLQLGIDHFN